GENGRDGTDQQHGRDRDDERSEAEAVGDGGAGDQLRLGTAEGTCGAGSHYRHAFPGSAVVAYEGGTVIVRLLGGRAAIAEFAIVPDIAHIAHLQQRFLGRFERAFDIVDRYLERVGDDVP